MPFSSTPPALLLDRSAVADLLSLDECREAVARAFAAYARGESLACGLIHGEGLEGEYHIKAAGLPGPSAYFACKANSSFFGNRASNGLPNIQGLILLFDARDGRPLAVIESGEITRQRTAAATALAVQHLARAEASTLLLAGAGHQARAQLEAIARVRRLDAVRVWARDPARAERFAAAARETLKLAVSPAPDLAAAARASDLIVTCTPAKRWIVGREMVSPGSFVAGVGADSADKQELEPALLAAGAILTDLTGQCEHVGDLHHAIAAGLMTRDSVRAELGAVIAGLASGRRDEREIVIFDSTGTALQDVAAAALVYERAVAAGRGVPHAFW